jgi:uncharacterized membrane protein
MGEKMLRYVISVIAGGIAGWLYYYFIGCASGACPITSNPWSSIIFGAVFGGLMLPDIIKKKEMKETENDKS